MRTHPQTRGRSIRRHGVQRTVAVGLCLGCAVGGSSQAAEGYQIQPIETRYAQTLSEITLNGTYRHFTDVTLQEADEFDGWSVDLDLTVPFKDRFQVRVFLPVRTEGDARLTKSDALDRGRRIDIEGYGDTYEFPSITFEHQLVFERDKEYNLAYYVGWGGILDSLETSALSGDEFNHRGRVVFAGVKADGHAWGDSLRLLGNFGARYYYESDDLCPCGDSFGFADLKGAAIFQPWGGRLYPVLELTYLGDFGDYDAFTLTPELIYPFNSHVELKAGVPIGLGGDGNQLGATAQLAFRF